MKIKTSSLKSTALDWAVAMIENPEWFSSPEWSMAHPSDLAMDDGDYYAPSINWNQGGRIIEHEGISIRHRIPCAENKEWEASAGRYCFFGPTPLVAAMRCFVANKFGNEVEIPDCVVEEEKV